MAKIMLVDAAFAAVPIHNELIRQGHEVITVGSRSNDPLVSIGGNHRLEDYRDTDALRAILNNESIEYIVPGCTDVSYASCLALNEERQQPGIDSAEAHATLHNKQQFRNFLHRHNLSAPKVYNQDAQEFPTAIIVKPVDSFSGKGITHIATPTVDNVAKAYNNACSESISKQAVIEEFVEGQLYSHSAFLQNGRIISDHFVEEHCSITPFAVDISHIDHSLPEQIIHSIRKEIEFIATELSLMDGLIHTQLICDSNSYWLVEITRRCPGDLYSQLIELSGGRHYVYNYVAGFLGTQMTASEPAQQLFVLRQTIKAKSDDPFYWLKFQHSACVKAIIPLAYPGQSMQALSTRQAIVFYQCEDFGQLQQFKNQLLAENSQSSDSCPSTDSHPQETSVAHE